MSMQDKKDYKDTIFLPKTSFPMKANLPSTEPKILEFWEKEKIYKKVLSEKVGSKNFTLHDGPPYANGHIHLGHALNKVIKDITVKFHLLKGEYAEFVPGWDCHGLPIEKEVEKKIGRDKHPAEIRRKSREYARKFVEIQKEEFKRLGVFATWETPYITMSPEYESMILHSINEVWRKGRIYSFEKPVFWCPHCITALAEAEVEYKNKKSPSIFVAFPSKDGEINGNRFENLHAVIWTTTPWTIPGNFALAFKPDITYVVVKKGEKNFIVAKSLYERKIKEIFGEDSEVVGEFPGDVFDRKAFIHPIFGRESTGVLADFVSEEEGTGIVHIAPGHGAEDFEVGLKYKLPVVSVLDEFGKGNENSIKYKGMFYEEINSAVSQDIKEAGLLLYEGKYEHSYPHCWRCKKPIVFRATRQWFIKVDDIKGEIIDEVREVKWIPSWGKTRMESTLTARPDWCISRQRSWGVPIPFVICKNCGEYLWSEKVSEQIQKDIESGEPDSWWEKPVDHFLPTDTTCPKCGGNEFEKGKDVLDVWIDSGFSFRYVKEREGLKFPADLYVEGTDQHRGWFQSSLILSVLLEGKAPYKAVFTHGFILDEMRRKMSKSLGNVISPEDIIKENGAEIVRLWSVFSDPSEDVKISEKILAEVKDIYKKIRNTIRFMLGVTSSEGAMSETWKDIKEGKVKIFPQDIYFLIKLEELERNVIRSYENMEYHKVARLLHTFADRTLSGLYLDMIKDTIYCDFPDSERRKSAVRTVYLILRSYITLISPILSFLSEEAYSHMNEMLGFRKKKSVFFEMFKDNLISELGINKIYEERKDEIVSIFTSAERLREEIYTHIDAMRKRKEIGSSLEVKVKVGFPHHIEIGGEDRTAEVLEEFFIISEVEVSPGSEAKLVSISRYDEGKKCPRCWKYSEEIGRAKHKELCSRCSDVMEKIKV